MKIVILGGGALGSLIGAHLTRAGEEITLLARGQRARLIREKGVTVTGLANFNVPVKVAENPNELQEADLLLVAVKTYDTEDALKTLNHFQVGSVLSIQNGVLKDEQLTQYFGKEKTLGAAATIGGEVMPTGDVRMTFNGVLYLGELPEGASKRVQTLAAGLARSGLNVEASSQIRSLEWGKYIIFTSFMSLSVLVRLELYKIFKDPNLAYLVAMLSRETAQLAEKLNIPIYDFGVIPAKTFSSSSIEEAMASIRKNGEMMEARGAAVKASALQDLERGRRLEVEEILGYAVRKGKELDLQLPTVETCYRLLNGINRYLS
jgi:2-dehydropantoate 2-reductase